MVQRSVDKVKEKIEEPVYKVLSYLTNRWHEYRHDSIITDNQ